MMELNFEAPEQETPKKKTTKESQVVSYLGL